MGLRIAIIAPIWVRVPPMLYGGIELIVGLLADGLVDRGHDVTLFATADAQTKAKVEAVFDHPHPDKLGKTAPEIFHVGAAYEKIRAGGYDIVHDHTFSAPVFGPTVSTPVLATLHGAFSDITSPYYRRFRDTVYYNAVSENQRAALPELRYVSTVYNTIDFAAYSVEPRKQDYLLCLGRLSPGKGAHLAIEAAKRLRLPLVLAGKIDPGQDERYFREAVEPHIDGRLVTFLGEVNAERKCRLMAEARAFLFPIQWPEPFGLVMLEAMAAGTPVVAFDRGAAPEVIMPGVSGFIARDLNDRTELIGRVHQLDPYRIRECAENTFPCGRMVDGYVNNYLHIARAERRLGRALTAV